MNMTLAITTPLRFNLLFDSLYLLKVAINSEDDSRISWQTQTSSVITSSNYTNFTHAKNTKTCRI